MERARVVRVRAQHPFQGLEDLRGLGLHAAVGLPQVPRPEVHERVGEQRGGVEVVGEAPRHLAHGVGVRAVQLRALCRGRIGVPLREGLDRRPLAVRGGTGQDHGPLDGREGSSLPIGVGRAVVVRSLAERDAPVAHRAGRVETRRLQERGLRLQVIEGVDEPQPLVEVRLCRVRGGDALVVAPEPLVDHRRGHGPRRRVPVPAGLPGAARERDRKDDQNCAGPSIHATNLLSVDGGMLDGSRCSRPLPSAALVSDRARCAGTASRGRARGRPSTSAGSPP